MKKLRCIDDLAGIVRYEGPRVSLREMRQSVKDDLAADDLRIRRQWRAGVKCPSEQGTTAADEVHRRAHLQWEAGRLKSAFRLMLATAKLGNPGAMMNTGYFYDMGIGVAKNRDSAMRWYKCAYRSGCASGANNVGTIYRSEGKIRRALLWFENARTNGDIDANLEIARLYLEELREPDRAIPYLQGILAARPGIDVARHSHEEGRLLLKGLQRGRSKRQSKK